MAHAVTNNIIILFQGKQNFLRSSFYLIVIRINLAYNTFFFTTFTVILSLDFQFLKKQLNFPVTGLSLSLFLTIYIHGPGQTMIFWLVIARGNYSLLVKGKHVAMANIFFRFIFFRLMGFITSSSFVTMDEVDT